MREKIGICQWFHYEAWQDLHCSVELLHELGVRHVRTGISWADYHRPDGKRWYDHQMAALADFEVLLSVWHTPPSIAEGSKCAGPPRRLEDYAEFIGEVIERYGDRFSELELWNEPNNRLKWDFENFDPRWEKFSRMVARAARTARELGKRTVLGGMIPVDPEWAKLLRAHGALDDVDVVAIHGFPGMWWSDAPNWDWYSHWDGWDSRIEIIADASDRPVWVTETGLATCDVHSGERCRDDLQSQMLLQAADASCERVYWYCLRDLDPAREAIEGFHVDENEYHLGLVTFDGQKKPVWNVMKSLLTGTRATDGGSAGTLDDQRTTDP